MTTFVGSHRILRAARPSETAAIVFLMTLAAMFAGRHYFEGIPYQVSYSAMIGDTAGLIFVILRAQEVLKRDDVVIYEVLQEPKVHLCILITCFLLGVFASLVSISSRSGQVMDVYHDVFIAPIFLYLAITLVPVILKNGTRKEMFEAGFYVSIWLVLVIFDWSTGMINQRAWLAAHGHMVWPVLSTTFDWSH